MKAEKESLCRFNVVVAICIVAVGLLVNVWSVSYLFASEVQDGMDFETKAMIWFFQSFCIITGLLLYFKGNTPEKRRRLLFGFFTIVLMVVSIEIVLHLFNFILDFDDRKPEIDKRLSLPSYMDKDWAKDVFRENSEIVWEFDQYLGFVSKEYHGKYFNIDSLGMRRTWNPSDSDSSGAKTVFMFGGSTMFGWSIRDDYTIASSVSRLLNEKEDDYLVYNYGQSGYIFMQEIMKLMLLLREGHRPDYVLFYDGINDVYAAYQSGRVGTIQNVDHIKKKLKQVQPTPLQHFILAVKGTVTNHCMIYRSLKKVPSMFVKEPEFKEVAAGYDPDRLGAFAKDISDHYAQSMDLLGKLSEAYGFKYICFWQPVIYTEQKLFPEESDPYYNPRLKDKSLKAIYMDIISLLEAKEMDSFYNIYDALSDRTGQVYSDMFHLSEEGNEIVAAKIVDIFEDEFPGQ